MEILRDIIPMIENQLTVEESWNSANEPPNDERFILVSFSNYSTPEIAYYDREWGGIGAYLFDAKEKPSAAMVNGWMELPRCKRGSENVLQQ